MSQRISKQARCGHPLETGRDRRDPCHACLGHSYREGERFFLLPSEIDPGVGWRVFARDAGSGHVEDASGTHVSRFRICPEMAPAALGQHPPERALAADTIRKAREAGLPILSSGRI